MMDHENQDVAMRYKLLTPYGGTVERAKYRILGPWTVYCYLIIDLTCSARCFTYNYLRSSDPLSELQFLLLNSARCCLETGGDEVLIHLNVVSKGNSSQLYLLAICFMLPYIFWCFWAHSFSACHRGPLLCSLCERFMQQSYIEACDNMWYPLVN